MAATARSPRGAAGSLVVAAVLAALAPAPAAVAQQPVTLSVERDGSARAVLTVSSDSLAEITAAPPSPITVAFDPASGGPGEWQSEMTVRANGAPDADYRFTVSVDSEGGAVAAVAVSLRVGAGGPPPPAAGEADPAPEAAPSWQPLVIAGLILAGVAVVVGGLALWQARPYVGRVELPQRPVQVVPRARRRPARPEEKVTPAPRPTSSSRPGGR